MNVDIEVLKAIQNEFLECRSNEEKLTKVDSYFVVNNMIMVISNLIKLFEKVSLMEHKLNHYIAVVEELSRRIMS